MSFRYWLGDMIISDITSAGFGLSKVTSSLTCLVPMTEDLKRLSLSRDPHGCLSDMVWIWNASSKMYVCWSLGSHMVQLFWVLGTL